MPPLLTENIARKLVRTTMSRRNKNLEYDVMKGMIEDCHELWRIPRKRKYIHTNIEIELFSIKMYCG